MRKPTGALAKIESVDEDQAETEASDAAGPSKVSTPPVTVEDGREPGEDTAANGEDDGDEDDAEDELSDAESFTLRDRQTAINQTHPFGIRIWKPALYKKNRGVEKAAEGDIHSAPGGRVSNWIWSFNIVWTLLFGWWLAVVALVAGIVCLIFGLAPDDRGYGKALFGLAGYIFYPFGKFVKLVQDEAYAEEDQGEGRSISEYEQWQNGDLEDGRLFFGPNSTGPRSLVGRRRESVDSAAETDSLLGRSRTGGRTREDAHQTKRRLFGRGNWTIGRIVFYIVFYVLVSPSMLLVSGLCWLMVFWIPMGRVTAMLHTHLRRHPLALSFHRDASFARDPSDEPASILLCTYRAVGTKYWKYTIDGTNIFLINLMAVVVFTIFDYFVLDEWLGLDIGITHPGLIFTFALFSIMPLAYFIGQAVASISAQSSMGLGAAINAFFSTLVEVFLYCVALNQGKGQLVEGSIVGSLFAGLLLLPGLSMCFGAIHRKTQRFNVRSAGVTSTMLLFAVVAAFGPTLFYKIYGSHELTCQACSVRSDNHEIDEDCQRCFFSQTPAISDRFFIEAVRPYCWFAAVMLFLSYMVGLLFTLRTHAAVIWNEAPDEKKMQASVVLPNGTIEHRVSVPFFQEERERQTSAAATGRSNVRDDQLYQRILGQSLKQIGMSSTEVDKTKTPSILSTSETGTIKGSQPHMPPPKASDTDTTSLIEGLSEEQNSQLVHHMAAMAATAATLAARDATLRPRRVRIPSTVPAAQRGSAAPTASQVVEAPAVHDAHSAGGGGHDAPNWGTKKSYVILLGATILYAIIAEILVNTVDVVLEGGASVDEKFLGITLFALVPNTTEFLNAISFAMNGNIALSMEIGSAYALQVCLLQVPALVLFSAVHGQFIDPSKLDSHTFNLIFPQWDMVTAILSVFLLSYVYGEGKVRCPRI